MTAPSWYVGVCSHACVSECVKQCVLSSLLCLAAVNEMRASVTCEETFDEICSEREARGGGGVEEGAGSRRLRLKERARRRKVGRECQRVDVCVRACVCVGVMFGDGWKKI